MFPSMANELLAEVNTHEREDRTIPAAQRQAAYVRALGGAAPAAPAFWRHLSGRVGAGLVHAGRWLEGAGTAQSSASAATE